jgi:hypothetical protein
MPLLEEFDLLLCQRLLLAGLDLPEQVSAAESDEQVYRVADDIDRGAHGQSEVDDFLLIRIGPVPDATAPHRSALSSARQA